MGLLNRRWLAVALMLWGVAACQSPGGNGASDSEIPSTACRPVPHAAGETEICGTPQLVAVLGPNLLELLLVLGGQPVAFGDHILFHAQDYTDPATQIPYQGDRITTQPINLGSDFTPNLEALLRSQPDLILAPPTCPPNSRSPWLR
ncbi:ABC transporter substrate-binding protein [Nodosilinea sp. LEGE 06152]|uniref:ABC transporter substrate-binding protein n=1 Tax=Nodosilinea sp. LEGE 06152 TaxID=2777966 RepID=UPI001882C7CD|nr:ABC transporter substrate-binding protein [Nodosilinea sp. LEGE 06152]MBE9156327.1 ABC transporter substrate-binding protein [Nodosilinea sp. LEGE 06152]